ncbi:MAG: hypothetical protein AB7T31_10940 [Gemmatimonadales bacterium]
MAGGVAAAPASPAGQFFAGSSFLIACPQQISTCGMVGGHGHAFS